MAAWPLSQHKVQECSLQMAVVKRHLIQYAAHRTALNSAYTFPESEAAGCPPFLVACPPLLYSPWLTGRTSWPNHSSVYPVSTRFRYARLPIAVLPQLVACVSRFRARPATTTSSVSAFALQDSSTAQVEGRSCFALRAPIENAYRPRPAPTTTSSVSTCAASHTDCLETSSKLHDRSRAGTDT